MATTCIGKASVVDALDGATFNLYDTLSPSTGNATVTYDVTSAQLSSQENWNQQIDSGGGVCGYTVSGQVISMSLEVIPVASSLAGALTSAQTPPIGGILLISGASIMEFKGIADILNVATGWLIKEASMSLTTGDRASLSLTLEHLPDLSEADYDPIIA